MTNILYSTNPSYSIVGKTDQETIFTSLIGAPVAAPISSVQTSFYDLMYNLNTSTGSGTEVQIKPILPLNKKIKNISISNYTPSIATVDSDLVVRGISNGITNIIIGNDDVGYKYFKHNIVIGSQVESAAATGYRSGSLLQHMWQNVNALTVGKVKGDNTQDFFITNNGDLNNPIADINPNLFASSYDFSGVAAMREGGYGSNPNIKDNFPIALVTNRHGLIAAHVNPKIGDRFAFKHQYTNVFSIATVLKVSRVPSIDPSNSTPDLSVVYLDTAITGVPIYKTLPKNFQLNYGMSLTQYVPPGLIYPQMLAGIPILRKAKHSISRVAGKSYLQINVMENAGFYSDVVNVQVTDDLRYKYASLHNGIKGWGIDAIPGDSGSPAFTIVNNELILVTSQHTTAGSIDISVYTDSINALMNSVADSTDPLKGSYALQHPNLSGFTKYLTI